MAVDVVMPQMGVSVSEGTISRWLKGVGETIEADETIVEISTDKVDTEVPSPGAGVITEILHEEGETVPVGTRIAVIGGDGASTGAAAQAVAGSEGSNDTLPAASSGPPATPAPAPEAPGTAPESPAAAATAEAAGEGSPEPAPHFGPGTSDGGYGGETAPSSANGGEAGEGRSFMSPVVARMVAEHGLDIGSISGTGRGGRVTKKDVEALLAGGAAPAPVLAGVPAAAPAPAAPSAAEAPLAAPARAAGPLEEVYRFSTIRRAISKHMRQSIETAAQVTSVIEVDMTRVVGIRKELKPQFATTYNVSLSYLPFILKAVIDGIGQWPWMNAEVQGDQAIIKKYVHMGIAVAVDDAKGLLVPVIKNAEEQSLVGLSRSIVDLADRARRKQLTVDEMTGATFTVTNPGVFGALIGTPIIPTGTVGIIDVEAIVKRPMVVTDEHGNDSIAIRHMMYLPISYDHRLIDGAYSAQFMQVVKRNLETWGKEQYGV